MRTRRSNPAFLNGVPELLVLHLLSQKPRYGYELVQAIKTSTDQVFEFGEGCIYPVLHRLENEGLLVSSEEMVSGRNRVVYKVTKAGRKQLTESISAWERVVAAVSQALQGGIHEPHMA